MSIKVVLFDNDGVVVNSTEMFSQRLARENNIKDEDIIPFFKEIFVPKCLVGEADLKREVTPWLSRWNWKGSVDELLEYWFKSENRINNEVTNYIKLLSSEGVRCYMATNQERYRTEYMRNEMGFEELFDGIFSSSELGYKKPSQEFYQKVFDAISENGTIMKDEIVYFDDEEKNVDAGNLFGFNAVHYSSLNDLSKIRFN